VKIATNQDKAERKQFEKWALDSVVNDPDELETEANGSWIEYVDKQIEAYWIGWVARAESR